MTVPFPGKGRTRLKEEMVLTNPRLRAFFIVWLAVNVVILYFMVSLYDPVSFEETVMVPEGGYRVWDTTLGSTSGMSYKLDVLEGGRVDVYIVRDTAIPPTNIVDGHPGVGTLSSKLPGSNSHYRLLVDNTDGLGVASEGPVEVHVAYENTWGGFLLRLGLSICPGVVLPLALLVQPIVYRMRHPMRRTVYRPTGRTLNAWDVDRWLWTKRPIYMVLIAGLLLLGILVPLQFPEHEHDYLVVPEGGQKHVTYSLMNEGLAYDVEVVLGDKVDVFLSEGGEFPDIDALEGHEHVGVTEASGLSVTRRERLNLWVDNSAEVGSAPTGPVEARVVGTRTYSFTALAFIALGVVLTLVGGIFLARAVREFRGELQRVDVPTGPGAYGDKYRGDYRPSGGACPMCGEPLVQGPVDGLEFCPSCNWGPPLER